VSGNTPKCKHMLTGEERNYKQEKEKA